MSDDSHEVCSDLDVAYTFVSIGQSVQVIHEDGVRLVTCNATLSLDFHYLTDEWDGSLVISI